MMLSSRVLINFNTKVFNTCSWIDSLPLNFIFIVSLNLFLLDLNMTISVCLTFNEILFAFSQLARFFRSIFTNLLSFLIDLLKYNKLVSFAKWWTLQNFMAWLRSLICSKIFNFKYFAIIFSKIYQGMCCKRVLSETKLQVIDNIVFSQKLIKPFVH